MHQSVEKRVNIRVVLYSLSRLAAQEAAKKGFQSLNIINRLFVKKSNETDGVAENEDDVVVAYSYTSVPYGVSWKDAVEELQVKFNVTIRDTYFGINLLQTIASLSVYPQVHDDYVVTEDALFACFCDEGSPLPLSKSEPDLKILERLTLLDSSEK